jgi:hypothetical protein
MQKQMTLQGVLLVRRVRWWAEGRTARPRDAAVDLSESQIARTYRGIDGEPWPEECQPDVPLENGLAPLGFWTAMSSLAVTRVSNQVYDAIVLSSCEWPKRPRDLEFLGYDYGYHHRHGSFSSLYHEALHSPLTELRSYAGSLNASLLLPSLAHAETYGCAREALRRAGRDLEDADCYPIAVYGVPRRDA